MIDEHDEDIATRPYDGRLMRRFLGYLRPYRAAVAFVFFLIALHLASSLAVPLVLKQTLDGPLKARDADGLIRMSLVFFAMIAASSLFEFFYAWCSNRISQRVLLDLRMQTFEHIHRLPVSFFDRTPVGRLVIRVTNDVETLNELFTSGLVEFIADLVMLAGIVTLMFVMNWQLALVTLAITPAILAGSLVFRRFARSVYREMRRRIARVNAYLNESINGIRTIQIFGREAACMERFEARNREYKDATFRAMYTYSAFYPAMALGSSIAVALLIWYGGSAILDGSLTFGAFVAFLYLGQKFFHPVRELAEKYNILQSAMASGERIFKLLDTPPAVDATAPAEPLAQIRGEVEFQDVSFSYDGKTPVLENVSFRVEPGQTLAVVGLTGAGKTTVMSLLLKFYEPTSGRILVDGRDIREIGAQALRRQMGLVLQDVFLFAGTVEENIRLGNADIDAARVREAAAAVNADRYINRLPSGYDTNVQERGAVLSTGERQLLSFARALAFDPRILVLDEATSSVDASTEQVIRAGLERLVKGRTAIVVAHRLSTVRHADRILVLHKGRVREQGAHRELVKADGMYRKLYRLQFQGAGGA